jgi:hypothetical protein
MTSEMRRLKKRERLMLKRAQLPEGEHTAINAEIKAVAEQLARLEAVRQRATEPAIGAVVAEWVNPPTEGPLADAPGAEPQIVDLRSRPPDAA